MNSHPPFPALPLLSLMETNAVEDYFNIDREVPKDNGQKRE